VTEYYRAQTSTAATKHVSRKKGEEKELN